MAVLTGSITTSPSGGSSGHPIVGALTSYEANYLPRNNSIMDVGYGVTVASTLPVEANGVVISGAVAASYLDDFYQHVHFTPTTLDVDFIIRTTVFPFKVWNGFLEDATLTSAVITGDTEITTNIVTPIVFSGGYEKDFLITVTPGGPPKIDALLTLTFTIGGDTLTYSMPIIGDRALLWEYPPNWAGGLSRTNAYRTDVFKSRSGKEQRRSIRNNPRVTMEFKSDVYGQKLRHLERDLTAWQNKPFVVPDYATVVNTTAPVAVDDESVTIDVVEPWVRIGETFVIENGNERVAATIVNVIGHTLSVRPAFKITFAAGSRFYRGLSGYLDAQLPSEHYTRDVASLAVRFSASPSRLEPVVTVAPATYNGRELFLKKPNWANRPKVDFAFDRLETDFGRGQIIIEEAVEFSRRGVQSTFLGRSRADVSELEQFYDRMKGQRGEFYAPTWRPDLIMTEAVLSGGNTLVVQGSHVYDRMVGNLVYRHIAIVKNDGSVIYQEVSSMSDTGLDTTEITIAGTWPSAINPADVSMVCWMPAWRLATDNLTISWITDTVANVTLSMQTVEDE